MTLLFDRPHAGGLLGGHAYYIHWGVVQISLANLIVIVAMVALFLVALVLPFPGSKNDDQGKGRHDD